MGRIIGIVHRVKQTAEREARPTLVAIHDGKRVVYHDLTDETAEIDFLLGRFPTKFRVATAEDDLSEYNKWQIKFRLVKKDEDVAKLPTNLLKKIDKEWHVAVKVPCEFDGLKAGDTVAMCLGGSGDRFGYAIANHGNKIGVKLIRVKPSILKEKRDGDDTKSDHLLLVQLATKEPELFQEISGRDSQLIRLREVYYQREDAMKARVACEQRLRQRLIGKVFLDEKGCYPEGSIEDMYEAQKASDIILSALSAEEQKRERELEKLVTSFDVYKKVFDGIKGLGPMIAARLLVAVGDIRRFSTEAKFKKFCGVHVMDDGSFPRRRTGIVASWHPEARQALYLVADQFNRRPDSEWGKRLLQYKAESRLRHPDVICKNCRKVWSDDCLKNKHKRMYSDGHIHKMAIWRTLTKFAEWLYKEWTSVYDDASESTTTKEKTT